MLPPIREPVTADDYHFHSTSRVRSPHVREAIAHTASTIAFDGYFYLEPPVFRPDRPVKRVMYFQRHIYLIAIYKKTAGKNTSVYSEDEEYGSICFFPTELTEIHYTVLDVDPSKDRYEAFVKEMEAEEPAIEEESNRLRSERERAELEAYVLEANAAYDAEKALEALNSQEPTDTDLSTGTGINHIS